MKWRRAVVLRAGTLATCLVLGCDSDEPSLDGGTGGSVALPSTGAAGAMNGAPGAGGTRGGSTVNTGGMMATNTGGMPPLGGSGGQAGATNTGGSGGVGVGGGGAGIADAGGAGAGAGGGGTGGADAGATMDQAVPSQGCGKALGMLTTGTHTITSSNTQREFTIDVPSDYDPDKPYRLIFAWHWINSSDDAVVNGQTSNGGAVWAYYGLKNQADRSGEPAIFIAPQSRNGRWDEQDHVLFDDLLALAEVELCIDTTRVFATGFSFGAMQTYSLSTNHQMQLRAVSALAPANFNIYLPTNTHEPIAYMSTTGMGDQTCPWDAGNERGAKYAALGHAEDNACTIPDAIPTTMPGSRTHLCYDFTGCRAGYPVKVCTFDGGHIAAHADGGNGDNGTTSWIPEVTWEFFTQF